MSGVSRRTLPGFSLGLGYTVVYLSLLVLIPLAACFVKAAGLGPEEFAAAAWTPRARAAYALTFGAALTAAAVNVGLGLVVAWTLVRYDFPLRRLVDALVDVPLALPTAVAGVALASARGLGEYGSVIFISSNVPVRTEIAPVLVVARLEEFAYREAAAVAVVLLVFSFAMLAVVNLLERWSKRHGG